MRQRDYCSSSTRASQSQFTVKNAVCERLRRQHTAILTVNLISARTSGAALRATPLVQAKMDGQIRRMGVPQTVAYGEFDRDFAYDSYEWGCSHTLTMTRMSEIALRRRATRPENA